MVAVSILKPLKPSKARKRMGPQLPHCLAVYERAFHKAVYVTQGFVFLNMVSFESKLNPSDMSIRALARNLNELQKEPEST